MLKKNLLLGAFLIVCIFICNVEAIDTLNQDIDNQEEYLETIEIMADTFVKASKLNAEAKIKISENVLKASEQFGVDAAKIITPIAGVAACAYAVTKLYLILEQLLFVK